MEVTISGNLITILRDDGTEQVINGLNVVDEGGIRWEQYNTAPPVLSSDPYTQPNPTFVDRYKVVLHFNDNRWEEIPLGTVTNQVTWTDDLTGAAAAVSDLSAALVVSGGGGGGVSSVSASSPLSSSGGANPNISLTGIVPANRGGAGSSNGILKADGSGNVSAATPGTDYIAGPAGSDTQVQFNNSGALGASADLTFDGSLLGVGNNSGDGIVELGAVGGSGEVSSPGTMNVEGQDVGISAGDTVTISTAAQSRLAIDADGAFGVNGSDGTDGQVLMSSGSGAEASWETMTTDDITDNSTIGGGIQNVTASLNDIADAINNLPAPPVDSVNGQTGVVVLDSQDIDTVPFFWVTSGSYTGIMRDTGVTSNGKLIYSPDGNASTYPQFWYSTGPGWRLLSSGTDILYNSSGTQDFPWEVPLSAWLVVTGDAPVPQAYLPVVGPTVQDALEQLAAQISPQYLIWEGYISQSDTSAPTVVELTNTLGETPVLAYSATGTYTATLTGAFPTSRTSWFSGSADPASGMVKTITITPVDDDTLEIYSVGGGWLADDLLSSVYFRIAVRVLP